MLKEDLKQFLVGKPFCPFRRDGRRAVDAIFEALSDALARGQKIELRGLGSFKVIRRAPKRHYSPRTKKEYMTPERRLVRFKCGTIMRKKLNPSGP